ncbi:MAG: class C sortase [Candidatus Faecousia sp.]|nr:class C sortase [Candidatus Faecousia sp.]
MDRRVRQWLGFLLMLAGLALLCGPFLLGTREEWVQKQAVETFYQEKQAAQSASQDKQPVTEETVPESTEPRDLFYEKAKAYNESLVKNGQDGMRSRADVESFALSALDFGYSENLIGTLEIPRMEIELGLYLGADGENMAKGAAVFGMTSLPLGGDSENTAIAGHRGWRGSPMFRDIQLLQMDDPIYITTPWDTLTYRVCEIRIVTPEDNSWCRIQPGRTLISLMTCHPYGQNYQRYIVFAELSPEDKPSEEAIRAENAASYDPSPRQITQIHADGTSDTVTVDPAAIRPDGSEYGAVLSNFVILAEDKMRIAAWIGAAVVALSGIWLTVQTLRDFKKGEKHHESE